MWNDGHKLALYEDERSCRQILAEWQHTSCRCWEMAAKVALNPGKSHQVPFCPLPTVANSRFIWLLLWNLVALVGKKNKIGSVRVWLVGTSAVLQLLLMPCLHSQCQLPISVWCCFGRRRCVLRGAVAQSEWVHWCSGYLLQKLPSRVLQSFMLALLYLIVIIL